MPRQPSDKTSTPRRHRLAQLLVFVLLVCVPLGVYLYRHRPNLYDSARTDLLEASRQLDIYHQDMAQLLQKDRDGSAALKASIRWLQKAAASDPDDLAEIAAIADGLQRWEAMAREGDLSSTELHARYCQLDARVQHLIKKRTSVSRDDGGPP